MAIDYDKLALKAKGLITKLGRQITLEKTAAPADANRPWNGVSGTPDTLIVPALQLLPNAVRIFQLSALGDATDLQGPLTVCERVYITFLGENSVDEYSWVNDGGVKYVIGPTQTLKPQNVTLLTYIGVRR
jgi:hypothetical protein